jgi:hypothetical protein
LLVARISVDGIQRILVDVEWSGVGYLILVGKRHGGPGSFGFMNTKKLVGKTEKATS